MCECNNYSMQTANTGMVTLTTPDTSLDGSGATTLLTAGATGGILRSLIIKAQGATSNGLVRVFTINGGNSALIDEIRIPTAPLIKPVNYPMPLSTLSLLPTSVVYKVYNLTLGPNDIVAVTTQYNERLNIFGEGLDISYPGTKPDVCCNFKEEYPVSGFTAINSATPSAIFTAPANYNGTCIESIDISALQSTSDDIVGLYMDSGSGFELFNEIKIPQSVQSSAQPTFKVKIPMNFNIQTGFIIGAASQSDLSYSIAVRGKAWLYA